MTGVAQAPGRRAARAAFRADPIVIAARPQISTARAKIDLSGQIAPIGMSSGAVNATTTTGSSQGEGSFHVAPIRKKKGTANPRLARAKTPSDSRLA